MDTLYGAGDEFIVIEEENAISEARWYYLVGTYDKDAGGTEEVKLYRDGVQVVTGDFSSAINLNNLPVRISGLSDSDALFTGKIDDVRIYNRALSPFEIAQLYLLGR